jgi:hypothetical protein
MKQGILFLLIAVTVVAVAFGVAQWMGASIYPYR